MKPVATTTDLRASFASFTVKKRIKMCGKPAVPNINARPSEIASIGLEANLPGPIMFAASAKLKSCTLENTWIDCSNMLVKLKPTPFITMKAMKVAPESNITALMICTQVVANIPPNIT